MKDDDYLVSKQLRQKALPTEGWHNAICAFVEPVGYEKNKFDPTQPDKFKVWMCWELDEVLPEGAGDKAGLPFMQSKKYTRSMDDRSNLHADVKAWYGRALTTDEMNKFDMRNLRGMQCQLMIDHEPRKDGAKDTETGEIIKRALILKIKPAKPDAPKMVIRNTTAPEFILNERATNTGTAGPGRREPMGRDYTKPQPASDAQELTDLGSEIPW